MMVAAIIVIAMMTGIPAMTIEPLKAISLRHELKHQINLREDLVLSQRLRKLFTHDKNAGPDGIYRVTSLYFDTPYDSALREKIDGVNRREKFRLRYYGTDTSFLRLEKKYKINGLCGKRSARMTQEPVCGRRPSSVTTGRPFSMHPATCGSPWIGISALVLAAWIF